MAISMLKIRRPLGRLIFNMGIAIPGETVFLIETAPWTHQSFDTLRSRQNGHHLPDDISNPFSRMEMLEFRFKFHWNCVPRGSIDCKAALVQAMARRRTLPERMLTQFTDAYMRHLYRQVRYLMRGINGEKLGLKCLNVGKILTI